MKQALPALAMIFGLVLPSGMPEVANIGFFLIAFAGMVSWAFALPRVEVIRQPAVLLPLLALVLLALAFFVATGSLAGALAVFYLAPLGLVGPVTILLRADGQMAAPDSIAIAALVGSLVGAAIGAFDWWTMGPTRAGAAVNNPIHFGAITLCLGFIALAGLYSKHRWVRAAAVSGPLWGAIAAWLSGSRGPLVALPAMLVVALVILACQFLPRRQAVAIAVATAAVALGGAAFLWQTGLIAQVPVVGMILAYLGGGAVLDGSTSERLAMYGAGASAFLHSPWFGYGFENLMTTAERYAPEGISFAGFDHLHSDLVDFAVIGGVVGVFSYLLVLVAGPVQALSGPRSGRRPAVLLSVTLSVGYAVMGLTNAMIGILTQTMLFALILAILVHLTTRDANPVPQERASSQWSH